MTSKRKPGRPKSDAAVREKSVTAYLTPDDDVYLKQLADAGGFKSQSQFVSAILERLILGGFSPLVWLKTGLQLQNHFNKRGGVPNAGFYFGVRPLPPLDDELEPISTAQWKKEVAALTAASPS